MGAFRSKAGNSAAQTGRFRQSNTMNSHLAGVIQCPWQESNLRHTVEETVPSRPFRFVSYAEYGLIRCFVRLVSNGVIECR